VEPSAPAISPAGSSASSPSGRQVKILKQDDGRYKCEVRMGPVTPATSSADADADAATPTGEEGDSGMVVGAPEAAARSGPYRIVDTAGEAGPKGGAVAIDEDMSEAELYWADVTKGRTPPPAGTRPLLVVMYGPPGSGKGRCLEELKRRQGWRDEMFVHLDPDVCRAYSKEYRLSICGAHAAALPSVQQQFGAQLVRAPWVSADGRFREEGYAVEGHFLALASATLRSQFLVRKRMLWGHKVTEMTDAFVDRALQAGYNCIYDTMGNEPNRFLRELMRRARSCHEYRVIVCGCFAPWEAVRERALGRATEAGRHLDEAFARAEYSKMFPRAGELRPGEVDTTHHELFAEPTDPRFLPAPFPGGELREGDERFLFDNSDGGGPILQLHDVTEAPPDAAAAHTAAPPPPAALAEGEFTFEDMVKHSGGPPPSAAPQAAAEGEFSFEDMVKAAPPSKLAASSSPPGGTIHAPVMFTKKKKVSNPFPS